MNQILRDLFYHMEWADAEHWQAMEKFHSALEDKAIRYRLHHIHYVQQAFLWVVSGNNKDFKRTSVDDFPVIADLKIYAVEFHENMAKFLDSVTEDRLYENVNIPWFRNPSLSIPLIQALTQTAMHSQYHRGQNATRFREIGGEPPLTDYIAWIWKGRPKANWL